MKLHKSWNAVSKEFKLTEMLGQGAQGQVVKAVHRESKKVVAIKNVICSFDDLECMKYVLREIAIARQLSHTEENFTTKLYKV
jgi:serine/threonine protein kinase